MEMGMEMAAVVWMLTMMVMVMLRVTLRAVVVATATVAVVVVVPPRLVQEGRSAWSRATRQVAGAEPDGSSAALVVAPGRQ